MEIITILGDSLAMVRPENNIYYKDTYAYKLNLLLGKNYLVLNKAQRRNFITKQTNPDNMVDDVLYNSSKYFIIQLGICDCAPRLFGLKEEFFLHLLEKLKFGFFVKLIIKFKSRHRRFFTKYFPKVDVKIETFREKYDWLLKTIIKTHPKCKIFLINIADTNARNKERSYNFEKNIINYNKVISELIEQNPKQLKLIDIYSMSKKDPRLVIPDGIHITKQAHSLIAKNIAKLIK